ncbi:Predicted acetyltransferase [Sporomusa malonica]|uniref:Predicted acetyltransferase n=2 Tax=Sporomusa malonica TaxID=112901 RepID=A0A1W2CA74_9FIRM|nr:Predicted acetyltransferase [Sporomusa malonica]
MMVFMDEIELVLPSKDLEMAALEYKEEHFDNQEYELHGSSLFDKTDSYDDWLEQLKNNSNETTVNPDWVVSTTVFAIRKRDSKIVGMVDIRHTLNEFLRTYGGNIGYGVRPSERNKGYATEILKLALKYCKQLPLQRVMLACYKDNAASRKTIIHCGGILEKEFVYTDGKTIQKFWIDL